MAGSVLRACSIRISGEGLQELIFQKCPGHSGETVTTKTLHSTESTLMDFCGEFRGLSSMLGGQHLGRAAVQASERSPYAPGVQEGMHSDGQGEPK